MLSFKGDLNQSLLDGILSILEEKLDTFDAPKMTRKKVFNVMVECLQNLFHHNEKNLDRIKDESIIVMLAKNSDGYSVITGNYIPSDAVDKLKGRIKQINGMDRSDVKKLYKEVLANGQYSTKGGGGLGIIDIAKKSGEKLDYGFVPIDNLNSFFSLNVKIPN